MASKPPTFDSTYRRWRAEFVPFETGCMEAVADFVYTHLDDLLESYYCEGHKSLKMFAGWAFERYLRHEIDTE